MDHDVILLKIESIQRCLTRIESKIPDSVDILKKDYDTQDIILLNLERLIKQTVDTVLIVLSDYTVHRPDTMAESFRSLSEQGLMSEELCTKLAKAVGFRNIAVHEYQKLNWDIVWSILNTGLEDFREFSRIIMELMK